MIAKTGVGGFLIEGLALSFVLLAVYFFEPQVLPFFVFIIPLTLFSAWFLKEKNVRVAIDYIAYTFFGIFYTAGLAGFFLLIGNLQGGRQMIVFILLFIFEGVQTYFPVRILGDKVSCNSSILSSANRDAISFLPPRRTIFEKPASFNSLRVSPHVSLINS